MTGIWVLFKFLVPAMSRLSERRRTCLWQTKSEALRPQVLFFRQGRFVCYCMCLHLRNPIQAYPHM